MTEDEREAYFAELRARFHGVTDKYELWELERQRLWSISPERKDKVTICLDAEPRASADDYAFRAGDYSGTDPEMSAEMNVCGNCKHWKPDGDEWSPERHVCEQPDVKGMLDMRYGCGYVSVYFTPPADFGCVLWEGSDEPPR